MTDEELGRAWCVANAKSPLQAASGWMWFGPTGNKPCCLPAVLYGVMLSEHPQRHYFTTRAEAYAAVGSALNRVLSFADGVRTACSPESITGEWLESIGIGRREDGTFAADHPDGELSLVYYPPGVVASEPRLRLWHSKVGVMVGVDASRANFRDLCRFLGLRNDSGQEVLE